MPKRLDRSAALLVAATWGLLVFGASVRVHGAGLACPDWPLCFGRAIPPIDFGVGLEFGHRVLAGLVSLGFLAIGGVVVVRRAVFGRLPVVLVGLAAAALALQIVLGGLTVLHLLAEWTVTSHLLTGNLFCLLLLLLALALREERLPVARRPLPAGLRWAAVAVAVLVPAQLALGGLIASSHAGLACGTWPTCDGVTWFPTWSGPIGLQVAHRTVAYGLFVVAAGVAIAGRRQGRAGTAAATVLLAVAVQATLGIANVLLRLPVELTLLHTAGAGGVVLATTWLQWEVWRSPSAAVVFVPGSDVGTPVSGSGQELHAQSLVEAR